MWRDGFWTTRRLAPNVMPGRLTTVCASPSPKCARQDGPQAAGRAVPVPSAPGASPKVVRNCSNSPLLNARFSIGSPKGGRQNPNALRPPGKGGQGAEDRSPLTGGWARPCYCSRQPTVLGAVAFPLKDVSPPPATPPLQKNTRPLFIAGFVPFIPACLASAVLVFQPAAGGPLVKSGPCWS